MTFYLTLEPVHSPNICGQDVKHFNSAWLLWNNKIITGLNIPYNKNSRLEWQAPCLENLIRDLWLFVTHRENLFPYTFIHPCLFYMWYYYSQFSSELSKKKQMQTAPYVTALI